MKKRYFSAICLGCLFLLCCGPPASASEAGDELAVIEHKETSRTDATPCQLTVKADVPDGFGLTCYAELGGEDGHTYRISLSEENGYSDHIFLPAGKYAVISSGVYGDNIGEYTFLSSIQEIVLDENTPNGFLSLTLEQYRAVEEQIENVRSPSPTVLDSLFPTGLKGIQGDEEGYLHYELSSSTPGRGVTVTGNADGTYDILIAIERGGVIGEARYSASLDGGQTAFAEGVTDENVSLGRGMSLHFWVTDDNDEFCAGDTYAAHVYETYTAIRPPQPYVLCEGSPAQNHSLTIRILSPGCRGMAKFTLSEDEKTVCTDTIPEEGFYPYADDLSVVFADGQYEKNKTYEIHVRSHHKETDYTPLYFLCAAIFAAGIGIYIVLTSRKERMSEYVLRPRKPYKEDSDYE